MGNRKWKGWKEYEERPLFIRAIQVCDENLDDIIEAINNVPGCGYQSFDGRMLLARLPGHDMFHARAGEYIRVVARKLERMNQEDFENLYEPRMAKIDLLKKIEYLEEIMRREGYSV